MRKTIIYLAIFFNWLASILWFINFVMYGEFWKLGLGFLFLGLAILNTSHLVEER